MRNETLAIYLKDSFNIEKVPIPTKNSDFQYKNTMLEATNCPPQPTHPI